jgi:hypothetical protein
MPEAIQYFFLFLLSFCQRVSKKKLLKKGCGKFMLFHLLNLLVVFPRGNIPIFQEQKTESLICLFAQKLCRFFPNNIIVNSSQLRESQTHITPCLFQYVAKLLYVLFLCKKHKKQSPR